MKNFQTLNTDYYQISMVMAYIMNDKANEITGFEGFVRHIKSAVNPTQKQFYIFDGEKEIHEFIKTVREELKYPEFKNTFIELVQPKITAPNKDEILEEFNTKFDALDFDFEYMVVKNGTKVFPLVPVFQFKGPKWIGQLLETMVTNIYNGRTGIATINYFKDEEFIGVEELDFLENLMEGDVKALDEYKEMLEETAKEFRGSNDKILLEAAFRRCPSKETADLASEIALKNGWNGTSNVSLLLEGKIPAEKVGGTMAHAFVMSFEKEEDAFIAWDKIFPGTTMLIDTYDVINASTMIKRLINEGKITKPNDVRIDSDPLDEYAKTVDENFDGQIDIFISGDMSVEKFEHFEFDKVPYSKAMAGTKYVYNNMIVEKLNSGFVYKIVQYEKDGEIIRPEKKANGKKNYAGLKKCSYDRFRDELTVWTQPENGKFGFCCLENMTENTIVKFV